LWAKGLKANEIHSEMRPVYGDKYFTRLKTAIRTKPKGLLTKAE